MPTYADEPRGPDWLRKLIGDEYFQHIAEVLLVGSHVYTDRLAISDEMFDHIASLDDLEGLILTTTDVSDADLERIGKLNGLKYLLITNAPISDAGLVHLRSLQDLEEFYISETTVTEEGIEELQKHLPNCRIGFRASTFWD